MLCQGKRWGVVNPVWCLSTLNGSQRLCINDLGQHCVTWALTQWGGVQRDNGCNGDGRTVSLLRVTLFDLMQNGFVFFSNCSPQYGPCQHAHFQHPHLSNFRSSVTLLVTHWLLRLAVLKIQWQDIKLPSKNSSSGHEIGMHIKENFPMPLEAVKSLFHVAARGERQFLGRAHTKRTKKESVIMGHLWLHTFHLPLCVTVINILLTENTRPRWFTGANYTMYLISVSLPAGQTVPVPFSLPLSLSLSLCLPLTSSLTIFPLLLTNSQKYFFAVFPSSWVSSFS